MISMISTGRYARPGHNQSQPACSEQPRSSLPQIDLDELGQHGGDAPEDKQV